MRAFLRGLAGGSILSCLRAVAGVDLLEWGAVDAHRSYGWRAAALLAVGLGLWIAREESISSLLLLGAAAGYAVHGLLLANAWMPAGTLALACTAIAGIGLVAVLRPHLDAPGADREPATFLEMIGLAAAAAGAAIAVEGIGRHVRLFGAGLAQDDTVAASVCLVLLILGAVALGRAARKEALRGLALPIALAACACACLPSLPFFAHVSTTKELGSYLGHFGLGTSSHGTIGYDAVISGTAFALPALLLGAGLAAARGRSRILSVLVGACVGLLLIPGLLEVDSGASLTDVQSSTAETIMVGCLLASGGAIVAILSLSDRSPTARWSSIAVAVLLALPATLKRSEPVQVLSPWERRPIFPSFLADTPEGLVSVDSYGILEGSWLFVSVDRHRVSPEIEGAVADGMRLRASLDLLPRLRQEGGKIRLLLVGQLTPERARILRDAGVGRIDRTAAWWRSMPRIEQTLWSSLQNRPETPAGEVLPLDEARNRIARDDYDIVIAMPFPGDAPYPGKLHVPKTTTVVRWIDLDEPAVHRNLGNSVALVMDGLERPAIALVEIAATPHEDPFTPLVLRPGPPRAAPTPFAWLHRRRSDTVDERTPAARSAMMARLADAEKGGPLEDLTAGFELFFAARSPASPAGDPDLPEASLDRFRAAALAKTPDPTVRRTWEALARALAAGRSVEKVYAYVQPIADKHRPWPELEEALARADLDSQRPRDALARLEPMKELAAEDFQLWFLLGEAQCAAGDPVGAIESWKRASKLRAADALSRRRVVVALIRARDEEGVEAGRKLLAETPGDQELRRLIDEPVVPGPAAADPCAR